MHVPWGWIKQRPHFLAEELDSKYNVGVYVSKSFRSLDLITNDTKVNISSVFKLPLERFWIIRVINKWVVSFLLQYIYKIHGFKYVWITDLRLYPYIENILTDKQKLIYDCMDDVVEFKVLQPQYLELEKIETKLFKKCDLVIFSSAELKKRKYKKYNISIKKCGLVYNALDESLIYAKLFDKFDDIFSIYTKQNYTVLTYIGTVSNWFDFDLIEKSLNDFEDIVYFIIGPIEHNTKILEHDRIIYFGSIEHKYIKSIIVKSDILIMPFKVNRLIEAVDPVKMYEYIAFGNKIISVYYDELKKFSNYINLYKNYDELSKMIYGLKKKKLNNDFIENNTWKSRTKEIIALIKNIS